jgi:hypothetical protein
MHVGFFVHYFCIVIGDRFLGCFCGSLLEAFVFAHEGVGEPEFLVFLKIGDIFLVSVCEVTDV